MTGLGVSPDALQRLANGLRASTAKLDAASKESVIEINAGESTPQVQVAVATLARATVGLLDGTQRTSDEVAAGRADYTKIDEDAAENMPNVDGGN